MLWSRLFNMMIFASLFLLIIADDPCRFDYPSKGFIDLTSLARTDQQATYRDHRSSSTNSYYKYSYNPCKPFSQGNNCINVSICQVSMDGINTFPLGTQQSAQWSINADIPTISYTYNGKQAVVELICSNNGTDRFEVLTEGSINLYKFRLIHQSACWNKYTDPCNPPCTGTCLTCVNKQCIVAKNTCYIADKCYTAKQTRLNDNLSCLQCQPDRNQTQWSFNPECSAGTACLKQSFILQNICPQDVTLAFYKDPHQALVDLYDFTECGRDRSRCQAGFLLPKNGKHPLACCPGYFCPAGQVCMIPCRAGSYCPSPLTASDGTCQTPVVCPTQGPIEYDQYGCGGSTFEGFCPFKKYCPNPTKSFPCPNRTSYCPTGVIEPLSCLNHFKCINGVAHRGSLFRIIFATVGGFLLIYFLCSKFSPFDQLKNRCYANNKPFSLHISDYFKKRTTNDNNRHDIQLNIHLYEVKLRDVTRFDPNKNEGFTGCIVAGRITALMGGSGCGKSSLLDTIHGRRRLFKGHIKFAGHQPLSTKLTDYIGYVPQADIMHNDLTVFETVYYSARARRLDDSMKVIKSDVYFVLERLGLSHLHGNMTKTLSGGQRKRVNVAMEVAACPRVLLLDEPTSGLDTASCDELFDLLELIKCSEAGPVTIIMVIHQPSYELYQRIDDIFFLTPLCCLAYQGPRDRALEHLQQTIFANNRDQYPPARQNDSDTCFIMLTKALEHINNHTQIVEEIDQTLSTYSINLRIWLPFIYVMIRSAKQIYIRRVVAEIFYLAAYFLLGACIGFLFQNQQQNTCTIQQLPTIYFLISLSFGMLTCISSQRLFGVEIIDGTYERESRNYFHPLHYWLGKSLVDLLRLIFYPLIFLSILYIQIVPRATFLSYFNVVLLLAFVCSGIGQVVSVIFTRTEYAYLAGTIIALISCLLSGFSPRKEDLGPLKSFVRFSFSRHIQHLLFEHETKMYVQQGMNGTHLWSTSVETLRTFYSYDDRENSDLWLIAMGTVLRIITFIILYIKSEYRSRHRFYTTHSIPILKSLLCCEPSHDRSRLANTPVHL